MEYRVVIVQILLEERIINDFIAEIEVFAEQLLCILDVECLFFSILRVPYVVLLQRNALKDYFHLRCVKSLKLPFEVEDGVILLYYLLPQSFEVDVELLVLVLNSFIRGLLRHLRLE